MRAIMLKTQGGPENLTLEEVPEPVPGPGEVLIRTEAIGVSYTEAALRGGNFPPPVQLPAVYGFEAAGIVTAGEPSLVGKRVVMMNTALGAYAEYVTAPLDAVTVVPDGVSAADAVATANFGAVALCLLKAARLTGSETVLIEAAAGGVGGYLTQLAHAQGAARVIATAGTAAKRDYALSIGADEVVDHGDPGWIDSLGKASIDAVFESLAGQTTVRLVDALTPGRGRILLYGFLQGPPTITVMDLLMHGLTLIGCGGVPGWLDRVAAARPEVLELVRDGVLKPRIDGTLPLADAATAHERFDARAPIGKIILTPLSVRSQAAPRPRLRARRPGSRRWRVPVRSAGRSRGGRTARASSR
jgi:NADPH2:quinone reductase